MPEENTPAGQVQMTFRRLEEKYLLPMDVYKEFFAYISPRLTMNEFGQSRIYNIYFDTPDFRIINASLEQPLYKEKLRVRSYRNLSDEEQDARVFVEIKKKFDGVVYKRRETMGQAAMKKWLYRGGKAPDTSQIFREIDWFTRFYKDLRPVFFIAYDRLAYYQTDFPEVRITFDTKLRYRTSEFNFQDSLRDKPILSDQYVLMEIKIPGSFPMWLSEALDQFGIYPVSFSKYGTAYKKEHSAKKYGKIVHFLRAV